MKNNIIANLLMEISAMIIIIVISIPIWNKLDNKEMHEIANYYDNYYYIDFDIENNDYGKMITVYNNSNTLEHYNLVMKINESYLDDLKVYINEEEKNIADLQYVNKDNLVYIILDSGTLVASSKDYNIHTNKDIYYNIDVLDNI